MILCVFLVLIAIKALWRAPLPLSSSDLILLHCESVLLCSAAASLISSTVDPCSFTAITNDVTVRKKKSVCLYKQSHSLVVLFFSPSPLYWPTSWRYDLPASSFIGNILPHTHQQEVSSVLKSQNKHWPTRTHMPCPFGFTRLFSNSRSLHDLLVRRVMDRSPPQHHKRKHLFDSA